MQIEAVEVTSIWCEIQDLIFNFLATPCGNQILFPKQRRKYVIQAYLTFVAEFIVSI